MKVKTKVRAGGISHNHARRIVRHAAPVERTDIPLSELPWETGTQPPLVPLIRCANRTKAGDACGVCWYCRQASGWQGWYRP
jgi:hypothetical protein